MLPALELRHIPAVTPRGFPPLLFVHGAFLSAACWERHVMPELAAAGFDCYALSLRGHGQSEGHEFLPIASLDHYVYDLGNSIARLPQRPILIGHSMGCTIIQRWLREHHAPGAVFIAPIPPANALCSAMQIALAEPRRLFELNRPQFAGNALTNLQEVRGILFAPDTDDATIRDALPLFQPESHRAIIDLSLLQEQNRPEWPPSLLVGGEQDVLIPPVIVKALAQCCGVHAEILPGMGHVMMLEPRWPSLTACLKHWLETEFSVNVPAAPH